MSGIGGRAMRRRAGSGTVAAMDFGQIIVNSATRFADNTAVWCEGRTQTYRELLGRASRIADALATLGLVKGDRVGMLSYNSFHTPEQIAGIAFGGFVRAGVYAHETGEVNANLLELVDARALFVHADLVGTLSEHVDELPDLEHVIVFGGDAPAGTVAYEELLANARPDCPPVTTAPDELHVIRFSAGTTGRPKGIVHTVGQWMSNNDEYRWVTPQLDERDGYLAAGQLTHAAVLWFWPILQVGGRIVVMPAFDAGRALELIEEQRATVTLVVPTMIQALLAHPEIADRDVSSLRCVNYAASPISERTMTRAVERFGPVLYQLYAQSEIITVTMLFPHQHVPDGSDRERRLMRSVGRPTPSTTVTVIDEEGNPLPAGQVGEIAALARGGMLEIWKDPEASKQRRLPDGSIRTRDMGYVDEDGFLFLVDRKEDMIISGGYNIWPAELENAIETHPDVVEVCVVGVPHDKWGETPCAFVVRKPGSSLTADDIVELTRDAVGTVKKVTQVEFVDELPKSGIGKVLRRDLRDRVWGNGEHRIAGA